MDTGPHFMFVKEYIPTFTLQDIFRIIPHEVRIVDGGWSTCYFSLIKRKNCCVAAYNYEGFEGDYPKYEIFGDTELEAVFNMLKWCKQNNYI